jgi:hypothetical protein
MIGSMARFSLKDVLRGITLAAIGFGMLAAASNGVVLPVSNEPSLARAFLIACGGMMLGYGFAFWIKWPPYQMICAMIGMFAAQAWDSGNSIGLLAYIAAMALMGIIPLTKWLTSNKNESQ